MLRQRTINHNEKEQEMETVYTTLPKEFRQQLASSDDASSMSAPHSLSHLLSVVVRPRTSRNVLQKLHRDDHHNRQHHHNRNADLSAWNKVANVWAGPAALRHEYEELKKSANLKSESSLSSLGLKSAMWLSCDPTALPAKFAQDDKAMTQQQLRRRRRASSPPSALHGRQPPSGRLGKRKRMALKTRKERKKNSKKNQCAAATKKTSSKYSSNNRNKVVVLSTRRRRAVARVERMIRRKRYSTTSLGSFFYCTACRRRRVLLRNRAAKLLSHREFLKHDLLPLAQRYSSRLFLVPSSSSATTKLPTASEFVTQLLQGTPSAVLLGLRVVITLREQQQEQPGAMCGFVVDHLRPAHLGGARQMRLEGQVPSLTVLVPSCDLLVLFFATSLSSSSAVRCPSTCRSIMTMKKSEQKLERDIFRVGSASSPPVLVAPYCTDQVKFEIPLQSGTAWTQIAEELLFS